MRFSTTVLVASFAAAALSMPSAVMARMPHRLTAALSASSTTLQATATVTPTTEVGVSALCLAECAAKAAWCVHECDAASTSEVSVQQLGLTCKEECAVHAAECTAECALADSEESESDLPDVIDASNIESVFASSEPVDAMLGAWNDFKVKYGRSYETPELEAHRYAIFQENMAIAEDLHRKNPEATFGVNQFSDLHALEFKRQYLNFRPAVGDAALKRQNVPLTARPANAVTGDALPTDYDWRHPDQNRPVGVTAVKDQGQCGSCWAFSATEEVESAWILKGNKPEILSPEQTVDCDKVDAGCNGGDTVSAYTYIKSAGVQTESSYPYQAGLSGNAGRCTYNQAAVVAKITGFTYATPGCDNACTNQNEATLKENLYNVGPVSICVDASTWQTYTSGILTGASGCQKGYNDLDHCVQLVGYGTDPNGQAFWSVRNSWATSWGEAGYIRLSYGANTCGVADEATQVTV